MPPTLTRLYRSLLQWLAIPDPPQAFADGLELYRCCGECPVCQAEVAECDCRYWEDVTK